MVNVFKGRKIQWPLDKAGEQVKVVAVATHIETGKTTGILKLVDGKRFNRYRKLVKAMEQILRLMKL